MSEKIKIGTDGWIKFVGSLVSEETDEGCAKTLDELAVAAARSSYAGNLKGPEKDRKLLHFLLEHEHGTPLEAAVFQFRIRCPLYVHFQWVKHRWSSINTMSGRYTEKIADNFHRPDKYRPQSKENKQGSVDADLASFEFPFHHPIYDDAFYKINYRNNHQRVKLWQVYEHELYRQQWIYTWLKEAGLAKELARGVLGTAYYTQFTWTVNARSLMNFFILRCESHAQKEIRDYAYEILKIFKEKMPWTYEATLKYFPSSFEELDKYEDNNSQDTKEIQS